MDYEDPSRDSRNCNRGNPKRRNHRCLRGGTPFDFINSLSFSTCLVYNWSLWSRNFFCWTLPALLIFVFLTIATGLFMVLPTKNVLEDGIETPCYVFNNTRALEHPNYSVSNNSNPGMTYVDYVFVGYNLSGNESAERSFEYCTVIIECSGYRRDACGYNHSVSCLSRSFDWCARALLSYYSTS